MKRLNVSCLCMATYNNSIEVPDDMSLEDAIKYAKDNLDKIHVGILEYIPNSDELDEENCYFEGE